MQVPVARDCIRQGGDVESVGSEETRDEGATVWSPVEVKPSDENVAKASTVAGGL